MDVKAANFLGETMAFGGGNGTNKGFFYDPKGFGNPTKSKASVKIKNKGLLEGLYLEKIEVNNNNSSKLGFLHLQVYMILLEDAHER